MFYFHPAYTQEREESDVRALQAGKRVREGSAKVKNDKGGKQRVEAKLETVRHRRAARSKVKQNMDAFLEQ